jgi:SAM-dependent methyltransferase
MNPEDKLMSRKGLWNQYYQEMRLFEAQEAIDRSLTNVYAPKILDAGCGSANHFQFKTNSELVGIDISQEQLYRNKVLSEKILGDIQTYDFSGSEFDAIICSFVLEHLEHPEQALMNFVRGLSDKGIIVIVAPSILSLAGLVIKFTPFAFHKLVHRILSGHVRAATVETRQFPTLYRLSMAPWRVKQFAEREGLTIHYFRLYQDYLTWKLCQQSMFMKALLTILRLLFRLLTLGKCDIFLGTYTVIIGKANNVTSV